MISLCVCVCVCVCPCVRVSVCEWCRSSCCPCTLHILRHASAYQSPGNSMSWALSRVIGRALSPMQAACCAPCGGRAGGPTSLPQSVSGQTTSSRGTTRPAIADGSEISSCECIAGTFVLLAGNQCNTHSYLVDAAKRHTTDPLRNRQQVATLACAQ
jgi:hypothetical protein